MEKWQDWLWLVRVLLPHLDRTTVRYLLPHNGNLKVARKLRRLRRKIAHLVEVVPADLELPVLTLGQVKWSKGVRPEPEDWQQIYDPFWHQPRLRDRYGRRIRDSFYFEFLEAYERQGNHFDYRQTGYYAYLQGLLKLGAQRDSGYPDRRCKRFLALYERIKREGYRYSTLYHYIGVRAAPWVTLRFGITVPHEYYEIANGRHRAAIAAFLGIPRIRALEWDDSWNLRGREARPSAFPEGESRGHQQAAGMAS